MKNSNKYASCLVADRRSDLSNDYFFLRDQVRPFVVHCCNTCKFIFMDDRFRFRFPEELLQLHIHFWDMAIMYRPLVLKTSVELLCHHLLITSNMSSDPNNKVGCDGVAQQD